MLFMRQWLTVLILVLMSTSVWADSPFYFIAKQAPEGAMSAQGQDQKRVYLRWDLVEGNLPEDIAYFSLYRGDERLKTFPARGVMSAAQITALYQAPSEQQRLLETLGQLQEEALLEGLGAGFNASQFGQILHDRLNDQPFWGHLASRMDFNLAIARYRGWHDQPEEPGTYLYELRAHNGEGESRRVGLAEVNTLETQQILAPEQFFQIEQAFCDRPDFRDHYSVALNWAEPGADNAADRLANQLFISGYNLYRSRDNVDDAPPRDLASEAAQRPHDERGRVIFDDLERVNDTLLTITPDDDPMVPEWLETQDDLMTAGLKPGDRRAYYLVPRTLAGHYGPTVETLVVVRDMARPPAPWDVRPYLDEANQRVELTFDAIGLNSYRAAFGRERRFCNLNTAQDDGFLEFVTSDEDCATDVRRRVQLEVKEYLVYRFDTYHEAARFQDSDGDGYADHLERPLGTQCQPVEPFGGQRIEVEEQRVSLQGGDQIVLLDEMPAKEKGEVFWYRLASRSKTDRLSLLSEPVRVNFPDRTMPEPPLVEVTQPERGLCGCTVGGQFGKDDWQFLSYMPSAGTLTFQCSKDGFTTNEYPATQAMIGDNDAQLCANPDKDFFYNCGSDSVRTFFYREGETEVSCSLPADGNTPGMCGQGTVGVTPQYCEQDKAAPEGVVVGPLTIRVTPVNPEHCVTLNQQVSGTTSAVLTSCGSTESELVFEHSFGEFCGFAVTRDANNNVSTTTQIGCRYVPGQSEQVRLAPPQPISMTPISNRMDLEWAASTQAQSSVEIELSRLSPDGLAPIVERLPVVELSGGGDQLTQLDIPEREADEEEWCVRMRSFGPSAIVGEPRYSNWSASLCDTRLANPADPPPQWLPWPTVSEPEQGPTLTVRDGQSVYVIRGAGGGSQVPVANGLYIPLGEFTLNNEYDCLQFVYTYDVVNYEDEDLVVPQRMDYLADVLCRPSAYAQYNGVLSEHRDFMVYRQARSPGGEVSDFVQVSPMIDYVHWLTGYFPPTAMDNFGGHWVHWLRDPYIWTIASEHRPERLRVAFYDRAGLKSGYDYRYQFVYFDSEKRIRSWRSSDWFAYQLQD